MMTTLLAVGVALTATAARWKIWPHGERSRMQPKSSRESRPGVWSMSSPSVVLSVAVQPKCSRGSAEACPLRLVVWRAEREPSSSVPSDGEVESCWGKRTVRRRPPRQCGAAAGAFAEHQQHREGGHQHQLRRHDADVAAQRQRRPVRPAREGAAGRATRLRRCRRGLGGASKEGV